MENNPKEIQTNALRDAVIISAVPQIAFFLFGAGLTIFGTGYIWGIATIASCLWWVVMMWIGFASSGPATERMVQVAKWSYFPLLAISPFIWMGIVKYCS